MRNSLTIWFVILVFLLPLSGYGIYRFYKSTRPLPVLGNIKGEEGRRAGDFNVTDQLGKSIDRTDLEGRIVVVDFFFTSCATICPDMTRSLARVQQVYRNASDILICSFSVDPESDSSAALREYAAKYGVSADQWHLLTGDKKEIYRLARNGFRVVATDGDGGPGDFIHSEKLILLDRKQQIRGYYDGTSEKEVNKLIKDIKKLRNEK